MEHIIFFCSNCQPHCGDVRTSDFSLQVQPREASLLKAVVDFVINFHSLLISGGKECQTLSLGNEWL